MLKLLEKKKIKEYIDIMTRNIIKSKTSPWVEKIRGGTGLQIG